MTDKKLPAPVKAKTPRKRGRPKGSGIIHKPENHMVKICEWISEGKTLRDYCRQPNTPSFHTVYAWQENDPEFARRFARARDVGHDLIAEDCLEIIDTPAELAGSEEGGFRRDSAHVTWLRNRAEYRLKLLAKWNPKKYGDRTIHAGDDDNPIAIAEITRKVVKPV